MLLHNYVWKQKCHLDSPRVLICKFCYILVIAQIMYTMRLVGVHSVQCGGRTWQTDILHYLAPICIHNSSSSLYLFTCHVCQNP